MDLCHTPRETFVSSLLGISAKMLSLHRIPKAEEGIPIEVTTNQAFDLIASPIKMERALSKRVIAKRVGENRFLG